MFIVLDDDKLKKKLIALVGESLRGFMTHLSGDYITNPNIYLVPPYGMYKFIGKDT